MSAKEHDELFELIHSLTKAERRYFKLHFQGIAHSEVEKYIKVFDALAAMPAFDKALLEKKFKGEYIIRYYSKTKSYIIDAIFAAMRAFYQEQSLRDTLYNTAANLRLLLSKGLYTHFERLLAQTKQLCYETEILLPLLDILQSEEIHRMHNLQETQSLHAEINTVLDLLREEEKATIANREAYALYTKYGMRPPEEARTLLQQKIQYLEEMLSTAKLTDSRTMGMKAIALCQHSLGDNLAAYQCLMQCIAIYDAAPPRYLKHREEEYLRTLGNAITYIYSHRDYALFREAREKVRQRLEAVEGHEAIKFELNASHIFLEISLKGDYSTFRESVQYVEQHQDMLPKILAIRRGDIIFNISLGYLKTGSPNEAVRWLLKLFDVPGIEERTHIYTYARMYEILLHWKLENTDLVLSRTLSFKRYLNKRDIMGELEKVIIRFMNAAVHNDSTKGFAKAIRTFTTDLEQLDKTQYSGIMAHYTDLLQWFMK